ncbi:MAG: VWA domain-containing protein [Burkholderiaceae bacterium]
MDRLVTDLVRVMRAAGSPVSTTEAIDAVRTVALVGYASRDTLKDALATVLAKSVEEKTEFDRVFDLYFARRGEPRAQADDSADDSADSQDPGAGDSPDGGNDDAAAAGTQGAGSGGAGAPGGGGGGSPAGRIPFLELAQADDDRIAVAIEQAGARTGVENIRFATQVGVYTRRIMETLGVDELEQAMLEQFALRTAEGEREANALIAARAGMQSRVREYVERQFEVFGRAATQEFMLDVVSRRTLGQLDRRDLERMKTLIARMARRLAVRHSRRLHRRHRGNIDLRGTLRANAGHDGVPFDIAWKRERRERPRIVAICDVSGSVARYVRFLLLFLFSLVDTVSDIRAFAFSNRLVDVGADFDRMGFEPAMEMIVNRIGMGSTDYGQAFGDLHDEHWSLIDRRTTVLILGDGRSNYGDPRVDILEAVAARAKRVVWLCPEHPSSWGSGDSCMLQYRPFCHTLSYCATAFDLERAIDEILLAYD